MTELEISDVLLDQDLVQQRLTSDGLCRETVIRALLVQLRERRHLISCSIRRLRPYQRVLVIRDERLLEIRREIASVASSAGEGFTGLAALASLDDLAEAGNVKPSMLQDVLAGRPMECDAIVDAPRRIGQTNGVPTPSLDVVSALLGGLDGALREG